MAETAQIKIITHGSEYSGDEETLIEEYGYDTFSKVWTNNPNTGQPWTWDEINALQAGVALLSESSDFQSHCTQVFIEVGYTPAGIARPLVGGSLAGNSLVGKGLARCI
jgi:hypothetical protein